MKTDSISEDINNSLSLYLHPSDGIGAERYCGGELHLIAIQRMAFEHII